MTLLVVFDGDRGKWVGPGFYGFMSPSTTYGASRGRADNELLRDDDLVVYSSQNSFGACDPETGICDNSASQGFANINEYFKKGVGVVGLYFSACVDGRRLTIIDALRGHGTKDDPKPPPPSCVPSTPSDAGGGSTGGC